LQAPKVTWTKIDRQRRWSFRGWSAGAPAHKQKLICSTWITNEDPKIKGEAEDKIKAPLDAFAADFA